jgi:hypothetical protein
MLELDNWNSDKRTSWILKVGEQTGIQEFREGEEQQLVGNAEQDVSENLALWKSRLKV